MHRIAASITTLLLLAFTTTALAQEAQDGPRPAAAKGAAEKKSEPPPITDPAVLAILDAKPKDYADELHAVMLLAQLGQPDLARQRLKKLMDARLSQEELAALAGAMGTPTIMRLAKDQALAPEAAAFAAALQAADTKVTRDPQRLQALAVQLGDTELAKRQDATLGLLRAGGAAVLPLIDILLDPARQAAHREARSVLLQLESNAIGPLAALIHDPARQVLAVRLLGSLRADSTIPNLMAAFASEKSSPELRAAAQAAMETITGRTPDTAIAIQFLQDEIQQQLDLAKRIESLDQYGGEPPQAIAWQWLPEQKQLASGLTGTASIARRRAANAARSLATHHPTGAAQRLVLSALLAEDRDRGGQDQPLSQQVLDTLKPFGVKAFDELLAEALKTHDDAVAAGAAQVLGRIGEPSLLISPSGTPSPLAVAAKDANRRVRFAATEAICRLRPDVPFPGSSAVSDSLKFFAHTTGARRALIVDPRSGNAAHVAGMLTGLGYQADIATNGRDAYAMATSSPDYEFALIHVAIDRPRADFLLRQLRADSRTAQLPIGLIALPLHVDSANRLAEAAPRTAAFAEPQNAGDVKFMVERLLSKPGCQPVPFEVRQQQAAWAIEQLAAFAEKPVPWLDARAIARSIQSTLYAKGMLPRMVDFLADAGTASGQLELVQLAAENGLPLPTRQLAALAFARSVQKHGILLESEQVLKQYARYNANAGKNQDTHKVMTIVLDAMEARRAASSGQ